MQMKFLWMVLFLLVDFFNFIKFFFDFLTIDKFSKFILNFNVQRESLNPKMEQIYTIHFKKDNTV